MIHRMLAKTDEWSSKRTRVTDDKASNLKSTDKANSAPSSNSKPDSNKIYCAIFSAMPEELDFFHKSFAHVKTETINVQGFEFHIYDVKGSAEAAAKVLLKILDALILKYSSQTLHELEMNTETYNEAQILIKKLSLQPHPD